MSHLIFLLDPCLYRNYRPARVETPSHTGGISKEARDRVVERLQKNKDRNVLQASSKNKDRERERYHDEKNADKYRHSGDEERGSNDRGNEAVVFYAGFIA
jgi:pre-mRNA-splicing factor ATP-dependent RNA helicase DHX38/PRP16